MVPHVEGRIAELKSQLKITDAQMPQWNRFADALRAAGKSMGDIHQQMMEARASKTLPERLALREKAFAAHIVVLKTMEEALQPLYASFSDEQKKIADGIRIGPMGML
ncbi:MAG: Spy/CpxP family protein refolding chaperone [Proteobacteria bacterium]|nr:Spy/CpxP family protein refolding chaperone [Pseudomonadota bacterium]